MKHLAALLIVFVMAACSHDDKKREDFPNATQKGEKESNERLMEKSVNDTTAADTALSRP